MNKSDMSKKYICLLLCFCMATAYAQKASYRIFDNISLGTEA